MDSTGESLHKRGYRSKILDAPISEVLAAGLIAFTGYKGEVDFYDLMCGSGTILFEAALIAQNVPSGYFRKFYQFMKWADFDSKLLEKVKKESNYNIRKASKYLYGSDLSKKSIDVLREGIASHDFFSIISVKVSDISQMSPHSESGLIVINPPYDDRLRIENIDELYEHYINTI